MKLLLDTHIWLWSLMAPERLTRRVMRELRADANEMWLSAISVWEAALLIERGRIHVHTDPADWLKSAIRRAPVREAPITFEIARESRTVEVSHQDPADRFVLATAKVLDLTLVTGDQRLSKSRDCRVLVN